MTFKRFFLNMYALLVIFLIGCSLPSLAMNSWGSVDDHDRVNNTLIQQQLTTLQSLGVKLKNNGLVIPLKRGNQIALALALSGSQELLAGHDVHLDYFDQLSQDHVPLLRCLPKLVSLKLYTSNLDAAKGRILSDILDHHRSKLTSLDLSQYVKLTDDGLIALQQSMNSLPHLKVISLKMQETFSNTGFLTLSSILPNLISLEELDLGEMKIGAQRETQFLSHLSKLTNLKKLDVSYNELTGNFLIFLKPLSRLMNLNVRCNLITGKKLRLFPKSKFKDSLTILNISGNQIDDEGFSHITTLPNLSTLNIEHNGITDEGVIEVIDLHSLTFLDISCNKISDDGVKFFLENSQIELSIN